MLVQSKDYCKDQDKGLLFIASEVGLRREILIGIFSIIIFGFVLFASILAAWRRWKTNTLRVLLSFSELLTPRLKPNNNLEDFLLTFHV